MTRHTNSKFDPKILILQSYVQINLFIEEVYEETNKKNVTKGADLIVSLPVRKVLKEQKPFHRYLTLDHPIALQRLTQWEI